MLSVITSHLGDIALVVVGVVVATVLIEFAPKAWGAVKTKAE